MTRRASVSMPTVEPSVSVVDALAEVEAVEGTRYQTMPPLPVDVRDALESSIRDRGVQVPVIVDEDGNVLDGHHRREIAVRLGIHLPVDVRRGLTDAEKVALSISLNADRRQLTRAERREVIAASIKADPEATDREHSRRIGTHHATVATVRTELEASGEVVNISTLRRDPRSGRASQPASKPKPAPEAPAPVVQITPKPGKPQRRALTEAAKDVGWELRKAAEKLTRIQEDDRFSRNKNEVASLIRGHLMSTIEACQGFLDVIDQSEGLTK